MQNVENTGPGVAETGAKKSLKERAVRELERYAIITVYLWLLFALFSLHKQLVQGHGISFWLQGFAFVNALIFGKVMLIGQALEVGKGLERRALAWVVLGKSLIFAILLLAFHIAEEAIRAWFVGQPLSAGFADFGGSLPALVTYATIFFCRVDPFLRLPGCGAHPRQQRGGKRFRLIED